MPRINSLPPHIDVSFTAPTYALAQPSAYNYASSAVVLCVIYYVFLLGVM